MKREIIEIRSNINPMINWLVEAEKEREEREKKEREEKYAKEREERDRKEAEWKKEHPILDKYTYISSWNYNTYSYQGDAVNIYFYEWSDIEREPRMFYFIIPFYRFLDACKINFTEEDNSKLKTNKTIYVVCKPGCNDLIMETNYESLKSRFMAEKILETVPNILY